ncbi:7-deoxyloganetin glucosyltransferase [Dichanthelium oligosanthes]|uniref:Glycosyltransferase n=1 Tax=Dichanthelium oligosanthes TaxID=888268 RepID=A0A1E5V5N5_9POAL|nr:7-deoxyloganetin glucosyltransferase [Dichanthelium oligosanthes]
MGSITPEKRQPHAVCLPCPAQGHITPVLKLAKLLHVRGFHVTFVNTEFNHRRLLRSRGPDALNCVPGFHFAAIPDGLPPSDADATQDIPTLLYSTMTTCLPHLLALLSDLNAPSSETPPVTCLVVDGVMSFGYDAAREIGVPVAALWTASACGFMGYRNYRQLIDWGLVPFKDDAQLADVDGGHLATLVNGARGMCDGVQLRDFPSFIRTTDRADILLNILMREAERLSLPDAVMINTFDDLEATTLETMRAILPPVHTVGPLLLRERFVIHEDSPLAGLGSNLWKEQEGLLEWLDGRAPRSVVYVNYGSITVMTNSQLLEFAWGLSNSGYAFVWNIRPDLVKGESAVLPPEFASAVEGRALLTTWCSQEAVLQHQAVGVFLTHSGWNSTLESLCAGVPMLSWPFFAEQQTNCRYKRTEWGVGLEIGGEVQRDELAAIIREAMDGEKGREMHRRAVEWKEKAVKATLPGGPAEANLDKVIDKVLLSKKGGTVSA